jgi:hypothetical protein
MMGRKILIALGAAAAAAAFVGPLRAIVAPRSLHAAPAAVTMRRLFNDSLLGMSGKLRARFLPPSEAAELQRALGSVRSLQPLSPADERIAGLTVLAMVPFGEKIGGRVGLYRMGYWPGETRTVRSGAYENPLGFVQVTPANQDLWVSEHFRLRDFVTKDQIDVWPKYLVLREALIDKLELTIAELQSMGYPVTHLAVMSGFRHPAYNQRGVGRGGRAQDSRHQFGDAADVFADNDRNGMQDDLDGDGRITVRDGNLIIRAVERVEAKFPALTGGMGRYHATHAHGPFVHVDVRGNPARWGGA